jgi:hypothetical protein
MTKGLEHELAKHGTSDGGEMQNATRARWRSLESAGRPGGAGPTSHRARQRLCGRGAGGLPAGLRARRMSPVARGVVVEDGAPRAPRRRWRGIRGGGERGLYRRAARLALHARQRTDVDLAGLAARARAVIFGDAVAAVDLYAAQAGAELGPEVLRLGRIERRCDCGYSASARVCLPIASPPGPAGAPGRMDSLPGRCAHIVPSPHTIGALGAPAARKIFLYLGANSGGGVARGPVTPRLAGGGRAGRAAGPGGFRRESCARRSVPRGGGDQLLGGAARARRRPRPARRRVPAARRTPDPRCHPRSRPPGAPAPVSKTRSILASRSPRTTRSSAQKKGSSRASLRRWPSGQRLLVPRRPRRRNRNSSLSTMAPCTAASYSPRSRSNHRSSTWVTRAR